MHLWAKVLDASADFYKAYLRGSKTVKNTYIGPQSLSNSTYMEP